MPVECSYLGIQATGPDYWAGKLNFPLAYKLYLAIQRAIDDEQFLQPFCHTIVMI